MGSTVKEYDAEMHKVGSILFVADVWGQDSEIYSLDHGVDVFPLTRAQSLEPRSA